jgi:hypothetical protein
MGWSAFAAAWFTLFPYDSASSEVYKGKKVRQKVTIEGVKVINS